MTEISPPPKSRDRRLSVRDALRPAANAAAIGERLACLVAVMAERGWDCVFATSPESVLYFSGALIHTQAFMRRHICGVLVTRSGEATLVTPEIDKALAARASPLAEITTYKELTGSAVSAALEFLQRAAATPAVMALEKTHLPAVDFEELTMRLPSASWPAADEELARLRMVKSAEEVETMGFAARAMEQAILQTVEATTAGAREDEIAIIIGQAVQGIGGGKVRSVTGLVASGRNLQVQHHFADTTRISPGNFVRVGCRSMFEGYHAMVVRMAVVGEGSARSLDHYVRLHEAHLQLLGSLRPGTPASQVFEAAAAVRTALGVNLGLVHVGNGIGLEFKERPKLAPGSSEVLQENMVLAVISNSRSDDPDDTGIRYIVDMVALEAGGARLLSHLTDTSRPLRIRPGD